MSNDLLSSLSGRQSYFFDSSAKGEVTSLISLKMFIMTDSGKLALTLKLIFGTESQ